MFWWTKWFPWRWLIGTIARRQGFLDPLPVMAKLQQFSQPSEVREPVELLRAGVIFHARGLINSRVIQHNLDWIWPYWIERQFNPRDVSFVPRAFSITHVNLTHRNWTAVGLPNIDELPIVDPRGMVTPLYDRWSIDAWIMTDQGHCLIPSRSQNCRQWIDLHNGLSVVTEISCNDLQLQSRVYMEKQNGSYDCKIHIRATSSQDSGWLIISLRPQNPEGISFIHAITLTEDRKCWLVDDKQPVLFDREVTSSHISNYSTGDVSTQLFKNAQQLHTECEVGMASAAAMFKIDENGAQSVSVTVPIKKDAQVKEPNTRWGEALEGICRLQCPDASYQYLYDIAIRTLVLHSPSDIYPGPYTYKRFWFRDAAYIISAMLVAGLHTNARRSLDRFSDRQTVTGYFHSQEGEWDSNGQALWIMQRYALLTGKPVPEAWLQPIKKGAHWIIDKLMDDADHCPHAGLLPAGFSAEHLGPNDYYYWDDYWAIAGLQSAAGILQNSDPKRAQKYTQASQQLSSSLERSLQTCDRRFITPSIPASPYRRMDAGAIGSVVASYPLCLVKPDDLRMHNTIEFLLEYCFIENAFFQDIIHSGFNAYLTMQVAQVLLRSQDRRFTPLMDAVANLASPTGQWPEAIHPRTRGGCMGDGQHVWAAAEWILLLRNCLLREEGNELVLGSGIPERWIRPGTHISFGPAPTRYGNVQLDIECRQDDQLFVQWKSDWRTPPASVQISIPGFVSRRFAADITSTTVSRISAT